MKRNTVNEKENIAGRIQDQASCIGEDDFVSLAKDNIVINFHLKHPALDLQQVYRTVKRTEKFIQDRLEHSIERIEIDIYDSMAEMRQDGRSRSRYASWIAGIFDGKIRVIEERDSNASEALYIMLTHELVHLAVSEISKDSCPYWIDEGLAVYMSQELPCHYREHLIKAVKKNSLVPIETLTAPLPADAPEDVRQLVYSQCSSLAEYIIATWGWGVVKFLIQQSRRRPLKLILTDMSLNYYLLEQGWKRWFLKTHA